MIVRNFIVRNIDLVVALALLAMWVSLAGLAAASGLPMHAGAADCTPAAVCETSDL